MALHSLHTLTKQQDVSDLFHLECGPGLQAHIQLCCPEQHSNTQPSFLSALPRVYIALEPIAPLFRTDGPAYGLQDLR